MTGSSSVIIDVDTGLDDAIALTYAFSSPSLRPLAVTCVAGNVGLDSVIDNTLGVLEVLEAKVPVAAGAGRALNGSQVRAPGVHGNNGLGGMELDNGDRVLDGRGAVELIADVIEESETPVHLVALGPLTNVANLITLRPQMAQQLASIFIMGGSAFAGGNQTATAEFNFLVDTEAADVVLRSGLPITVYGLDVFNRVLMDEPLLTSLLEADSPAAVLAGRLANQLRDVLGLEKGPLGDGGALVAFDRPDLVVVERLRAAVECGGRHTRGALVVDRRPPRFRAIPFDGAEVGIALDIDVDGVTTRFANVVMGRQSAQVM